MTGTERKQHFKTTLVALLTASVLTVTALAGCGGDNKDAEKSAVTGTEIVTSVVESVYLDDKGNPVTDPSGNPIPVSTAATTATKAQGSKAESRAASKT